MGKDNGDKTSSREERRRLAWGIIVCVLIGAGLGWLFGKLGLGIGLGLALGVGFDGPSRKKVRAIGDLDTNKDVLDRLGAYIDGKMKRYNLLFAVNGGAYAIARLNPLPGALTVSAIADGAIIFTAVMAVDIWLWGQTMRDQFVGSIAFTPPGKAI